MSDPDRPERPDDRPEQPDQPERPDQPAGPEEDETEAAFRRIVEHYGERASLPEHEGPSDETSAEGGREAPVVSPGLFRLAGRSEPQPPPTHEDHFVPPPPPPVPWPEPRRGLAWVALFGSPTLMLLALLVGVDLPSWLVTALGFAFVGGFVFLVATMRRGPGDGWDDGARL